MILTRKNYKGIVEDIKQIHKELGVEQFRLMRYVPSGKKEDILMQVNEGIILDLINTIEDTYISDNISVRFPCSPKFCLRQDNEPLNKQETNFRKKYLSQNCHAGINWLSVSYDNKLRVCPHSNVYFFDLSEHYYSLKEIWDKHVLTNVLEIHEKREVECKECVAWNDCKGGCYLPFFLKEKNKRNDG